MNPRSLAGVTAVAVHSYQLGVNSFIKKPVSFQGLVEALRVLERYWFEIVELPPSEGPP